MDQGLLAPSAPAPNQLQALQGVQPNQLQALQGVQPTLQVLTLENGPMSMNCPHCKQPCVTNVRHQMGTGGWLVCRGGCFCTGGTMGCCALLPCCVKDFQDATHSCNKCNQFVGTKKFLM